jgi:rhodanese-related sulfurtransferase
MPTTLKELMDAAEAAVPRVTREQAEALVAKGAMVLDVRDAAELAASGKVTGAKHVSRGMLEFRADPASHLHDPELKAERPVIMYCGAGGRAALAGKLLKDMGFAEVYNLGAFKDWVAAGGAVDRPLEPGM